jgi:hypothetical protein
MGCRVAAVTAALPASRTNRGGILGGTSCPKMASIGSVSPMH